MSSINHKGDEEGLLDDAGKSRRFIQPDNFDLYDNKSSQYNSSSTKKISKELKYGYYAQIKSLPEELSTADLIRIATGYQQAIIKVTSYGKGVTKIFKHLAYITRDFDLPAEDQNQSLIQSKQEANDLLSSWETIYFDKRKNSRDTVHMVFSAPPTTCRNTFKELTRDFLQEEFGNEHDYLFVPHEDTDHPHIHTIICLRSVEGYKLNPRKNYLLALRKRFAGKCREQGIQVEASRRFERGLSGKGIKSSFVRMHHRQEIPKVDAQLFKRVQTELNTHQTMDTGNRIRDLRNNQMKDKFFTTAKSLFDTYMKMDPASRQEKDLIAAKLLLDFSKNFPAEKTRADCLKEKMLAQFPSMKKNSELSKLSLPSLNKNKSRDELELNE